MVNHSRFKKLEINPIRVRELINSIEKQEIDLRCLYGIKK